MNDQNTKVLSNYFKNLKLNKTIYLKSVYTDLTKDNVELLINYLQEIGGKALTLTCRKQNAFKTTWSIREENLRIRCHVQNAADYLRSIKDNYLTDQIKVVIADVAKYVNILDSNEDVSFILVSTNTLPSAIHFDIAQRLFITHKIRDQNQNNYNADLLTIYALRLALESRIRGLLGIDYATNKGKTVGLNSLIKISKDLKSVLYSKDLKWNEIEWVNKWINHHMHRHLRPYPWIIYLAIDSLKLFIDPKEPFIDEIRTVYSFYSATYVENEKDLHEEIESSLKHEYPEIEITWLAKREILKPVVKSD
ncbi:hypothetical protein B0A79_23895 [Flavobacterium piscis]|uniref:Uncharacterized protein n=1 Tax=Flavobacterium piscis TaxID=1114874 RepID=A0ABX2XSM7_9FLAO|nr:hypothetical protein [Flavobacterium piscis]OCB75558.1 hypothetical protein FLP_08815 [Flavobacterium piscis]OXE95935.1 hypothetical protein B0A79_23895 [Flavobacterium piscis]